MASPEQKKSYQVVKQFKGLNTKANRTAIEESEFSWLENAMPIGYANIKITPTSSQVYNASNVAVTFANTPSHMASVNLNNVDYIMVFQADGSLDAFNLVTNLKSTIKTAGFFSASGISVTQWKNELALILDPVKGYFVWDGINVISVGSVGVIGIRTGGAGYTSTPLVTISAPNDANGIRATAVASVTANAVTAITVTNPGSGYTVAPTVTVTGGGASTQANAVASIVSFATGTIYLNLLTGGTGYINVSNITVTIAGGGGANAAATALLSGTQVSRLIMTNVGSGYTNVSNLTVTITGGGATTNATANAVINSAQNVDIASFSGRTWIAYGRTVTYSAAGTYNDFTSVSAGSVALTDSTLHGDIQKLLSANNFLYLYGDDSINVFSDVRVTTAGTTIFTNTNISASVGSKRKNAIFPYFRSVLFLNDYGIYALVGSTTSKVSDALDGIFANIDFTYPIYCGEVLLNNILCAAFNFRYYDAEFSGGYRYIQAIFFDKKWFFTSSQNTMQYIVSVPLEGTLTLYGVANPNGVWNLYELYSSTTLPVNSIIQSALDSMGDPIRDKQALKIGIESTSTGTSIATFVATVDSEKQSSPDITLSSGVIWQNNNFETCVWENNTNQIVEWGSVGYNLYKSDAQQWGKYLGMTIRSSTPGFFINGLQYEHELRARF
jgi:hypothetical protein